MSCFLQRRHSGWGIATITVIITIAIIATKPSRASSAALLSSLVGLIGLSRVHDIFKSNNTDLQNPIAYNCNVLSNLHIHPHRTIGYHARGVEKVAHNLTVDAEGDRLATHTILLESFHLLSLVWVYMCVLWYREEQVVFSLAEMKKKMKKKSPFCCLFSELALRNARRRWCAGINLITLPLQPIPFGPTPPTGHTEDDESDKDIRVPG